MLSGKISAVLVAEFTTKNHEQSKTHTKNNKITKAKKPKTQTYNKQVIAVYEITIHKF